MEGQESRRGESWAVRGAQAVALVCLGELGHGHLVLTTKAEQL